MKNKMGIFQLKPIRDMRVMVQLAGFIMSDKGDYFQIYFRGNILKVFKGELKEDGTLKGVRFAYFMNKTPIHKRIKYHKKINLHRQKEGKRIRILKHTYSIEEYYENVRQGFRY